MFEAMQSAQALPVGSEGKRSGGWWGVLALIVTEGSLFGYLLFTYFYLAAQSEQHWPPDGLPVLLMPGVNTLILLASSVFVWACERCIQRRLMRWSLASMALAFMLGIGFVVIQLNEWSKLTYDMTSNLYGSLYFTITGFHMLHVIVGLVILMVLLLWIALGYFDHRRYAAVTIGGLYWHFVDAVWLFVFTTLYLTPYLY
ncbi:cytochrome c oxidase subunit 3 [Methylobacter sp.]|uniref:cytochrome c oxidase subunit 3 n=1 Tax=Methylobacter sp. TaxID=2051955 RepID=UPI00248838A1|nr:cytochrome c oxidase subunit 3 [Methylobacter sp.]MDI1279348.1 cytochrome c oxidase subunit 3 [Methylobacter sp.]MDI1359873.1 cytochrome c oxidase subunit 3 [Methylobacter sp.]